MDVGGGNGHDTLFMARLVGAMGRVWAFDIQERAISSDLATGGVGDSRMMWINSSILAKATAKHLRSVQRQPERIRKYFEHGPVRYAA